MIQPLADLFYKIYAIDLWGWRRVIRAIVKRLDGGEHRSTTLRRIFADYHGFEIGMYSYGGCFRLGHLPAGTRIGRYGSFSEFWVFARNHPADRISMHPYFYNAALGYVKSDRVSATQLTIGHDVWIGFGAIVLGHVSNIGNGAVIAAGAIVTKNVPPYAIVAGNPARIIKYRFLPETTEKLEQLAWWNKSIEELSEHLDLFSKPLELTKLIDMLEPTRNSYCDDSLS